MENLKMDGLNKIHGGEYKNVKINGVNTCDGHLKSESITIDGTFKSHGSIESGDIYVNGISSFYSFIKCDFIDIDGIFSCEGNFNSTSINCNGCSTFKSNVFSKTITIDGCMSIHDGNLEASEIKCDGYIKVNGEISADKIMAKGFITANEIVGDDITIKSHINPFFKFIKKTFANFSNSSNINLIEATTIDLSGVIAKTVNGHNITIGPNCEIENIDCSGNLVLDPSSNVKNIINNSKDLSIANNNLID